MCSSLFLHPLLADSEYFQIIGSIQSGSANLGLPGPLYGKATQGFRSESGLGGWRCKDPSEEADRRRRGWTASRKISKDGSGSHSELLSRMDGIG